jgi:nitroreductase
LPVAMAENVWLTRPDGTPGPAMRDCLTAATAAPSIHNTQPWRFRPHGIAVDVYVDRTRRLDVVDPTGREMLLSLGAAVLNLRVAILSRGRQAIIKLLPSQVDRDLMATVAVGRPVPIGPTARALARAVPMRHTNRRPFANTPVPAEALADLTAAAAVEGGSLSLLDGTARDAVLSLVRSAEARQRSSLRYQLELAEWTATAYGRPDGVPQEAFGPWSAMEVVPIRDFGLMQPARRREVAEFETEPTIAVLYIGGDTPYHWLRAGEALERVLLTATVRGVAATMMSQPLEVPELRRLLNDPATMRIAQVVLRLGYGLPSPPSPRRPLEDVLLTGVPATSG